MSIRVKPRADVALVGGAAYSIGAGIYREQLNEASRQEQMQRRDIAAREKMAQFNRQSAERQAIYDRQGRERMAQFQQQSQLQRTYQGAALEEYMLPQKLEYQKQVYAAQDQLRQEQEDRALDDKRALMQYEYDRAGVQDKAKLSSFMESLNQGVRDGSLTQKEAEIALLNYKSPGSLGLAKPQEKPQWPEGQGIGESWTDEFGNDKYRGVDGKEVVTFNQKEHEAKKELQSLDAKHKENLAKQAEAIKKTKEDATARAKQTSDYWSQVDIMRKRAEAETTGELDTLTQERKKKFTGAAIEAEAKRLAEERGYYLPEQSPASRLGSGATLEAWEQASGMTRPDQGIVQSYLDSTPLYRQTIADPSMDPESKEGTITTARQSAETVIRIMAWYSTLSGGKAEFRRKYASQYRRLAIAMKTLGYEVAQ